MKIEKLTPEPIGIGYSEPIFLDFCTVIRIICKLRFIDVYGVHSRQLSVLKSLRPMKIINRIDGKKPENSSEIMATVGWWR